MRGVLTGKHAVISGGGTGIGRATAIRFAEEGAIVTIVGRRQTPLNETSALIGPACQVTVCDVSDQAAWEKVITDCRRLDVLVNNAALSFSVDALDEDLSPWQEMLAVNMYGPLYGCRAAGRKMVPAGGGRIVNITSIHGRFGEAGSAHYGMAKAAVNQLTRCLAVEWAPHNIQVNAIAPGAIDTPMTREAGVDKINEFETELFQEFYFKQRRIPMGRAGTPEEVAEAALFLAHPRNTYMTGQVLVVDGGLTATF